jgi:pimeloyl-ACP methyl ester carboxylesterase
VLVAAVGLRPERGEILDVVFHTPEEVLAHTLHAPASVPEYAEVYGGAPTPAAVEVATRNREMTARLTWKPYMHNPRLPHFLPRVTSPTLIVWGREDRIVPLECGEMYRRLLPRATLRVLERCGHVPPLEHPEAFSAMVLDFLGGTDAR